MQNDEEIRDHLEAALSLSLKAEHNLLAYIIEMALLEFANTEVHDAMVLMKASSECIDGRSD